MLAAGGPAVGARHLDPDLTPDCGSQQHMPVFMPSPAPELRAHHRVAVLGIAAQKMSPTE